MLGIGTLAGICLIGVAYAMTPIPKVNAEATDQGATVFWNDGKTPMMKIGGTRTAVRLDQISPNVQNAILAIEDHNFYKESAISPLGISRALVTDLKGGDTQGGSTITQQYVKNAYLSQERTITRKLKEIFISVKVGKQQDKKTILQNYLNTIYFGYGANGIEAAAEAYYGVHAAELTVPEAAVIAANVKQPQYYDPRSTGQRHTDAINRYNLVLGAMKQYGTLSAADYAKYVNHPKMTKKKKGPTLSGQKGYMFDRVTNTLKNMGYSQEDLDTKGLKIYTSWDRKLQDKAVKAVEQRIAAAPNMPKDIRVGLVSINPKNGEVVAAYGGKDYTRQYVDDAYFSTAQVGSGFKPYVLAAALSQNIGLKSTMDASGPAYFDDNGERVNKGDPRAFQVHNDEGNPSQPVVDLIRATQMSYNTVYVPLGFKAGMDNVISLAEKAGLPDKAVEHERGLAGLFLGQASMRVLDQASGYATIANDGKYIQPHSIRKVFTADNHAYHPERYNKIEHRTAFQPDVARDVQFAMQSVLKYPGTGVKAALPGREVAGKTGTTNENRSAWFNGFTPNQLVTSVGMWRYQDADPKHHKPLRAYTPMQGIGGLPRINGGDYPAMIWHDYMSTALEGKPVTQFEPPAWIGETKAFATPPPPSPSPTPTPPGQLPPCQPGQDPVADQCQPGGPGNNPICQQHPRWPQCQSGDPNPTPTCDQPVLGQCPTTGPPGKGRNSGNDGGTAPQANAARPTDE